MSHDNDRQCDPLPTRRSAAPERPPCPGCNRVLNWPYESGRWRHFWQYAHGREYSLPMHKDTAAHGYQHEHQDQWVECPNLAKPEPATSGITSLFRGIAPAAAEKPRCSGCGEPVEWRALEPDSMGRYAILDPFVASAHTERLVQHAQPDGSWRDCEGKREKPEPGSGLVERLRDSPCGEEIVFEGTPRIALIPEEWQRGVDDAAEGADTIEDLYADLDKAHQVYEQQVARIEALEVQLAEAKRLIERMAPAVSYGSSGNYCAHCHRRVPKHKPDCLSVQARALGFIEESQDG